MRATERRASRGGCNLGAQQAITWRICIDIMGLARCCGFEPSTSMKLRSWQGGPPEVVLIHRELM